jgi:16S rRNA (uracil1498-N3)-methyltransferase
LEQGGFTTVPRVQQYATLAAALEQPLPKAGVFGSLDSSGAVPLWQVPRCVSPGEPLWVLVGPERGFTLQEEQYIRRAAVVPVSLGDGVLRTETATMILTGLAVSLSRDNSGNAVVP